MTDSKVKLTPEEQFRSALGDLIPTAEKLAPFCKSVEEMVDMVKLALENDGQLKLLMRLVLQK